MRSYYAGHYTREIMDKLHSLLELAKKRKSKTYTGYTAIGKYNHGAYECDYISPYSISAHNEESEILIILQDWCSAESFGPVVCKETLQYGYTPSGDTNVNLEKLLNSHFNLNIEDTYCTNLFPYIKPGPMNAYIPAKDLYNSAKEFTLPLIEILQPKVVICLGKSVFNAVRKNCGKKVVYSIEEGVSSHFSHEGSEIFCQAHTGRLGQNNRNRGGVNRVSQDWELMVNFIASV